MSPGQDTRPRSTATHRGWSHPPHRGSRALVRAVLDDPSPATCRRNPNFSSRMMGGWLGPEPLMASLLEVPRCGQSPPSAWKLSSLPTGRLDRSWRTQPNEKGPAHRCSGAAKVPSAGGGGISFVSASAPFYKDRRWSASPRSTPGRRVTSPSQWREFERFVGQPIETEAGPGSDEQQTFRCLGIEPHNSWCNLAPLDEVL